MNMHQKSKKIISTAIISLFILSMFFATVPLALAPMHPTLTLDLNEGPSGTVVTITGTFFTAGTYRVYFDTNGNGRWNFGEPYKAVTAASDFTTTLTIPSVAPGTYNIRAGPPPYPYTATASAPFTVKAIGNILEEIEAKLDGTISTYITSMNTALNNIWNYLTVNIWNKLVDIEGKLWSNADSLKNDTIAIEGKLDKLGTFTGTDTVASLLYEIENNLLFWFGSGGCYSKTAQINGGRDTQYLTFIEATITEVDVNRPSQFTVTFYVPAAGSGKTTTIEIYVYDGTNYYLIKTYTSDPNAVLADTVTVAGYRLRVTESATVGGTGTAVVTYTYLTYP